MISSFLSPVGGFVVLAAAIILMVTVTLFAGDRTIEVTILCSQLAIVLPPLLILRYSKDDLRQALKLTMPKPAAWPAAVLLIIGGWLLAVELVILQNRIVPFPEEFIRQFEELFAELNSRPVGLSLFLLAVLPGLCEETLCRGFLLQSFLPKFGKAGSVFVTGLAFGLLHLDIYRFFPSVFLGILLGIIVIRTGSLLPAMLAHMLNNSFSFLAQKYQNYLPNLVWLDEKAAVLPPWYIAVVAIGLIVSALFWLKQIETKEQTVM